jgi:hypothetical protein
MHTVVISLGDGREAKARAELAVAGHVSVQPAVDLRAADPQRLYDEGLITVGALLSITQGRRAHHEIPSTGAVGYWQSQLAILRRWRGRWLMICDEDVLFLPGHLAAVRALQEAHGRSCGAGFDFASFGVGRLEGRDDAPADTSLTGLPPGWRAPSVNHYGSHCVLWSPEGTRRVLALLGGRQDIQFDLFIYAMHAMGYLDGAVQEERVSTAVQLRHASTIQGDCALCHVPPARGTTIVRRQRRPQQRLAAPSALPELPAIAALTALAALAAVVLIVTALAARRLPVVADASGTSLNGRRSGGAGGVPEQLVVHAPDGLALAR